MMKKSLVTFLLFSCLLTRSSAFSVVSPTNQLQQWTRSTTNLQAKLPSKSSEEKESDKKSVMVRNTRRNFIIASAVILKTGLSFAETADAAITPTSEAESLIAELELVKQKIEPIPALLQAQEWDQVRTILKTPPVNFLWNMGDSKNTVLKLARATDEVELIELKDDISLSLQMCDQLTYDNVFVYYQPGNGKVKIKEPTDLAKKAIAQLSDAIQMGKGAL